MDRQNKLTILDMIYISIFTVLIFVGALIKIPLPPVPITLQTLFVSLAGILLKKYYGAISVLIYVMLGLIGVPVFTGGGGIGYIFHPTFGYLLGMIIGTFVSGIYVDKKLKERAYIEKERFLLYLKSAILNTIIVYSVGVPYLILIMNGYLGAGKSVTSLIVSGLLLTIPGGIIKCITAGVLGVKLDKIIVR